MADFPHNSDQPTIPLPTFQGQFGSASAHCRLPTQFRLKQLYLYQHSKANSAALKRIALPTQFRLKHLYLYQPFQISYFLISARPCLTPHTTNRWSLERVTYSPGSSIPRIWTRLWSSLATIRQWEVLEFAIVAATRSTMLTSFCSQAPCVLSQVRQNL